MRRIRPYLRLSVVLALAVSLSLVGLYPSLISPVAAQSSAASARPEGKCCCGTVDGKCCGMACCGVSPIKSNGKNEQSSKPRGDPSNGLVFAISRSLAVLQVSGQGHHKVRPDSDFVSSSSSTLQSQHVLLQI